MNAAANAAPQQQRGKAITASKKTDATPDTRQLSAAAHWVTLLVYSSEQWVPKRDSHEISNAVPVFIRVPGEVVA